MGNSFRTHFKLQSLREEEEVHLFYVSWEVVPEVPGFCILQTEPEASENAEYKEQSGCPRCEAGQAELLWQH